MYDLDEAKRFIKLLTGSENALVHFQAFFDPKPEHKIRVSHNAVPEHWYATLDKSLQKITIKQDAYCGLYVCINETDGLGREEHNIINLRCVMADFDGQSEPEWKLKPHFVQKRDDKHGHAFWLLAENDLDIDDWSALQRQIALFYNTDTQVVDPCRVVRIAGSVHYKNPNKPAVYYITADNTNISKYTPDQIKNAHSLPADLDAKLNNWIQQRKNFTEGVGYDDTKYSIQRVIEFLKHAALPAIIGSGTHEVFRVAAYGHDHGVSRETMTQLMWNYYNPRCKPPWSESERNHFDGCVFRAYKYATSEPGCKTFRAVLNTMPALREPSCGWSKSKSAIHGDPFIADNVFHVEHDIDRKHRLSCTEAKSLSQQINKKTSHYELANIHDGLAYDGINLIRSESQFYRYTGKNWQAVCDELIKSTVQRQFDVFKPSDSMTNGIYRVLRDIVTVEKVNNGHYIDSQNENNNIVVFNNGMLDIDRSKMQLIPHTPRYFNYNCLQHNYNPKAKCPKWLEFLHSIWGDNDQLKMQLQMYFGYCLTNDVSLQKFAVFKGKSRAGKGVITDILTALIGKESICAPSLDNISNHSMLSQISRSSLCLIPDAHSVSRSKREIALSTLKAITGGDAVSYHEIYKGARNLVMTAKVIMTTNNMPEFIDPSGALVNRMLVFPFTKTFVNNPNIHLRAELLSEIEGITNWSLDGLLALRKNNYQFTESDDSKLVKSDIKCDLSPLSHFINQICIVNKSASVDINDIYSHYRVWSMTNGFKKPLSLIRFRQLLRDSDIDITINQDQINGITINNEVAINNVSVFPKI